MPKYTYHGDRQGDLPPGEFHRQIKNLRNPLISMGYAPLRRLLSSEVQKLKHTKIYYTTGDRSLTIEFVFWNMGEPKGWRIYIVSDINYGNRDISGHATNRNLFSDDTYHSICWLGKISTLKQAKAITSLWSDATALYIRNGGNFDDIVKRLLK